jgi:hypothetical protein
MTLPEFIRLGLVVTLYAACFSLAVTLMAYGGRG